MLKTGRVSGLGRAKRAGVRRFEHMKLAGTDPKNLRFFAIFGSNLASRQLRRGEGAGGGKSGWIRG